MMTVEEIAQVIHSYSAQPYGQPEVHEYAAAMTIANELKRRKEAKATAPPPLPPKTPSCTCGAARVRPDLKHYATCELNQPPRSR